MSGYLLRSGRNFEVVIPTKWKGGVVFKMGVKTLQGRWCTKRSKTCAIIALTKNDGRKSIREHAGQRQCLIGPRK